MSFRSSALLFLGLLAPVFVRAQTSAGPTVVVPGTPAIPAVAVAPPAEPVSAPYNARVLQAIDAMPRLQAYATTHLASVNLGNAVDVASGRLTVNPRDAHPSYCSGATYLVFLKTVADLRPAELRGPALAALKPAGQRDGEAIWGRWNANGPGTARLFSELDLGPNFTRWEDAQPGDFMKVWWNNGIGKSEHGHSVVYRGHFTAADGTEQVRFWSSNQKGDDGSGYGNRTVPRTKIARVLFSRLEHPERLARAGALPPVDEYLAAMLRRDSSVEEMNKLCRVRERP